MRGLAFYHGFGGMGGGGLALLLFGLLKLVFVVAIVVLIVVMVRRMHRRGMVMHGMHHDMMPGAAPSAPAEDEAVGIARKRFATGEITKEQFDEIMKSLV